jgi:hypothetical protein
MFRAVEAQTGPLHPGERLSSHVIGVARS